MKDICSTLYIKSYDFSEAAIARKISRNSTIIKYYDVYKIVDKFNEIMDKTNPDIEWDINTSTLIIKDHTVKSIWNEVDYHINLEFYVAKIDEIISEYYKREEAKYD